MKSIILISSLLLIVLPVNAESLLGLGQVWHENTGDPLMVTNVLAKPGAEVLKQGKLSNMASSAIMWDGEKYRLYVANLKSDGQLKGGSYSWTIKSFETADLGSQWIENSDHLDGLNLDFDAVEMNVVSPFVMKDGPTFKMWYTGRREQHQSTWSVGYAESRDGYNWEKYQTPLFADSEVNDIPEQSLPSTRLTPILSDPGVYETYEQVLPSSVLKLADGSYLMWYTIAAEDMAYRIGNASSTDGIHWQSLQEPVIQGSGNQLTWSGFPHVVRTDEQFVMWFSKGPKSMNSSERVSISVAVSKDGIHWREDELHNPVVKENRFQNYKDAWVSMLGVFPNGPEQFEAVLSNSASELGAVNIRTAAYKPTVVPAGLVSGTWTKEGSPYLVKGAITVDHAQTLTIEPGTTVEFLTKAPLIVNGRLVALGTKADPISFGPIDTLGYHDVGSFLGVWGGIRFEGTPVMNEPSILSYCQIEFGECMDYSEASGGGLYVDNFSKLTVENCLFQYNRAISATSDTPGLGGALSIEHYSNPKIQNNLFQFNYSGNLMDGINSHGGGISISYYSNPELSGNIIRDNHVENTGGGVAISYGSSPKLINNLIVNNTASNDLATEGCGGGVSITAASKPVFINNTISKNSAACIGGGVYFSDADPVFINTILSDNTRLNALSTEEWGHEMGTSLLDLDIPNAIVPIKTNSTRGEVASTHSIKFVNSCLKNGIQNVQYGRDNQEKGIIGTISFVKSLSNSADLTENFKPGTTSLILGRGSNSVQVEGETYHAPLRDLAGYARCQPSYSYPDMGCYESSQCAPLMLETGVWSEYTNNPVFQGGSYGAWDEKISWSPDVLFDNGRFHMWYVGKARNSDVSAIGYASSLDGKTWTKSEDNPVLQGKPQESWFGMSVHTPRVLRVGSILHMYFADHSTNDIGHAISYDGITWFPSEAPALSKGVNKSWDGTAVVPIEVIHGPAGYRMWYNGQSADRTWAMGYATSQDGQNWIKHGTSPVFETNGSGDWDSQSFYGGSIVRIGDYLYLWYHGQDGKNGNQIGRAITEDGLNWTRIAGPDVATAPNPSWNDYASVCPAVLTHEGNYHMWYLGAASGSSQEYTIGYTKWATDYQLAAPELLVGINENDILPAALELQQNFPNPFNPVTEIKYTLPTASSVKLIIYDMRGRQVKELVNAHQNPGSHSIMWDGSNEFGEKLSTGVYLARLNASGKSDVLKMLLLK